MTCEYCDDTGVEPCDNCGERDCGIPLSDDNLPCIMDGVRYGAGPCRRGCEPSESNTESDDHAWRSVDEALGEVITVMDLLDLGHVTEGDLADLGRRYDTCLRIVGLASEMRKHLEEALVETMPEPSLRLEGITVTREPVTRSRWKDSSSSATFRADIAHGLATKLATDVASGDINPERRNVIENAITELWKMIPSIDKMKAGKAREIGLAMSDYRDYSDGYNIKVVTLEGDPG